MVERKNGQSGRTEPVHNQMKQEAFTRIKNYRGGRGEMHGGKKGMGRAEEMNLCTIK